MPKKMKNKSIRKSSKNRSIVSNAQENISMMSLDSTVTSTSGQVDIPYSVTKPFLQDKMEESIRKVESSFNDRINGMNMTMSLLRSTLTEEQLALQVNMSSLSELTRILNCSILQMCPSVQIQKALTPGHGSTTRLITPASSSRRRSRSLNRNDKLAPIMESPHSTRSSSVGIKKPRAFVTPIAKYGLGTPLSSFATASKYTVQKKQKVVDQTMHIKRVMKAGEEAISTAGSPLFVHGRVPSEPEVYIPLQNGVILNIDTEMSENRYCVPQLDKITKKKLKIICDKLQRCLDN